MFLLPPRIRQFLEKKEGGKDSRPSSIERTTSRSSETGDVDMDQPREQTRLYQFDVLPASLAIKQPWFSLSVREREVAALVCMGYRNYEIAEMLGVGYSTVQTHLQNIFHKFGLRSRKEIRAALKTWSAEEWWRSHHY